ncbi:subtilisin-like protease SBT3.5 [Dioscorea cayenensis subsp. rotundata]|uniref:Subtilisin-like protease SBT3.5 n=1 Tax=Dioscorea cayennensis subsp. rotundata TaxID=55577 RepID=A0AB40B336_DIOCR|nr:subtilisin-like protease SBT3.5 [Dioscorea cayenensis subsp. rotundata]
MAWPYISGIVALLKSLHPSWSSAAIKSALVTTATITNEHGCTIEAEGQPRKIADPFDFGGGNVNPVRAADPCLIFDIDPKDYLKYLDRSLNWHSRCL